MGKKCEQRSIREERVSTARSGYGEQRRRSDMDLVIR